MPLKSYFKGHGEEVARAMRKRYGKDWERVFYATQNKTYGPKKTNRKIRAKR